MPLSREDKGFRIKKVKRKIILVKKGHTIKLLVLTNLERRILYLSQPYYGSVHDYARMKSESDPDEGFWFDKTGGMWI